MKDSINVTIDGEIKTYPKGTTFLEISKDYKDIVQGDIILAMQDNKLRELFKEAHGECEISFLTTRDDPGMKTYMRGMTLMMLKAFYDEFGRENISSILVEYSLGNGYYCDFNGKIKLTEELIHNVKKRMEELVAEDLPFIKKSISTDSAMKLFEDYGMYDKQKLFNYRRVSKTNIYSLGKFEDYYYGYMPPSTGVLKYFDLILHDEGFILLLPTKKNPSVCEKFKPMEKLFCTLKESNNWGHMMGIDTVGALDDAIAKGDAGDLILVQEALQEKKISMIAEMIKEAGDKKFIMIAGPSSSGKTTFSHRLSIQLKTLGLKPHPIPIDDYFVDREDTPKDEFGNYDYETLGAIDIEQFNEDMTRLLDGERVELPSFNFRTGKREYKGHYKSLGKDDILVIEGIHGLNDELSHSLPKTSKFKIYISALTQLNVDEHNRIPTTDGRLIRRIVRDARTRGTTAERTIAMWPSVRRGEEQNIFPFQEEADVMFNSALIYELAVLKQYVEPSLFGIEKECPEYMEAKRLLKFLDYFVGISSDEIPKNSILREFVGGSCFKV